MATSARPTVQKRLEKSASIDIAVQPGKLLYLATGSDGQKRVLHSSALKEKVVFKDLLQEAKEARTAIEPCWHFLESFLIAEAKKTHPRLGELMVPADSRWESSRCANDARLRGLLRDVVDFPFTAESDPRLEFCELVPELGDTIEDIQSEPRHYQVGNILVSQKVHLDRDHFLISVPKGLSRKQLELLLKEFVRTRPAKTPRKKKSLSMVLFHSLICTAHQEGLTRHDLPREDFKAAGVTLPAAITVSHITGARDYITRIARTLNCLAANLSANARNQHVYQCIG